MTTLVISIIASAASAIASRLITLRMECGAGGCKRPAGHHGEHAFIPPF